MVAYSQGRKAYHPGQCEGDLLERTPSRWVTKDNSLLIYEQQEKGCSYDTGGRKTN